MITIKPEHTYVAIWFASRPALVGVDLGADYLAVLWREPGTKGIVGAWRVRYYADDKMFGETEDVKHWYRVGPIDETDSAVIARFGGVVREALVNVADESWSEIWHRRHIGDGHAMRDLIVKAPFAHMQVGEKSPTPTTKGGQA